MKPLAVTGLGICSSLGIGREAFLRAMKSPPASTVSTKITSFDATKYTQARIAEVVDFDPTRYLGGKGLRTLDRLTKLLIVAARLALHDAGFKKDNAWARSTPEQVGLICSNAYGSLEAITELDRVATLEDARYINPAKFPNTVSNSAAGYVSIWEELRAINVSVSDGNCGGLDAVACGEIFLETGRAEALLIGGAEAMSEALYVAFSRLGALDAQTPIGEGAALLVTEVAERVAARGDRSMGELVGYGTAFVAPALERPLLHASQTAMERAVTDALADAEVKASDIDVVASGVSGLEAFDDAELAAIAKVLGDDACVAAPKALFGETLGACGAMGLAAGIAWLDGAPPTPLVRGALRSRVRNVLVTTMGFYGNASAVVLRAGTN